MTQMSPYEIVTIDEDESMATSSGPNSPRMTGSPRNGRVLYCRKCEGHGEKVILKNHAPSCPYILCTCRSCERLNQKRLKSFNKRNKEKLELAAMLTEQRRRERETDHDQAPSRKMSSCSSHSSSMDSEQASSTRTGLEGRSMSLGAMTVMSYDIWKAKCAAEKKRLEAEGKAPSPVLEEVQSHMRKRAHTFVAPGETKELPKVQPPHNKEKKGRYILLPTIPAMRIFVDEEMEKKMDHDVMDDTPVSSQPMENHMQEMKINSPIAVKPRVTAPTPMTVPTPVSVHHHQQNFMKTTVPMSMPALPIATMQAPMPSVSLPLSAQPQPISFPPATSAPTGVLSPEQLVILQNNILQQQNQALQQLLAMLPINNPTPPATTPSPDLFSLLKTQQLLQKDGVNQDLLQNLLQTRPQAIFSNSM